MSGFGRMSLATAARSVSPGCLSLSRLGRTRRGNSSAVCTGKIGFVGFLGICTCFRRMAVTNSGKFARESMAPWRVYRTPSLPDFHSALQGRGLHWPALFAATECPRERGGQIQRFIGIVVPTEQRGLGGAPGVQFDVNESKVGRQRFPVNLGAGPTVVADHIFHLAPVQFAQGIAKSQMVGFQRIAIVAVSAHALIRRVPSE